MIDEINPTVVAACETCNDEGEIEEDAYAITRGHYTRTVPCPTCVRGMERRADDEDVALHDAGWRDE